ncbi:MAG: hypothetical protein IPP25_15070 [Saprospiraceae bacterium]|nr:hypothetical protein [Candidatus Opimibacter skivensis]
MKQSSTFLNAWVWSVKFIDWKGIRRESLPRYRYTGNSMPGMLLFNSNGQLTKFELNCGGDLDSIAKAIAT